MFFRDYSVVTVQYADDATIIEQVNSNSSCFYSGYEGISVDGKVFAGPTRYKKIMHGKKYLHVKT